MDKITVEAPYVTGLIEPKNIISATDKVEINWNAIGAVSVAEAERFALDVLRVCAEVRVHAMQNGIEVDGR